MGNVLMLARHDRKADGKTRPILNVFGMQAHRRKRPRADEGKDAADREWKDPKARVFVCGRICAILCVYECTTNSKWLRKFCFGVCRKERHYLEKQGGIRALFPSCFKQRSGRGADDEAVTQEDVEAADMSTENAADSLTIRRKVNLLGEMLKAREPDGPSHVVVFGDHPTFKNWPRCGLSLGEKTVTYGNGYALCLDIFMWRSKLCTRSAKNL